VAAPAVKPRPVEHAIIHSEEHGESGESGDSNHHDDSRPLSPSPASPTPAAVNLPVAMPSNINRLPPPQTAPPPFPPRTDLGEEPSAEWLALHGKDFTPELAVDEFVNAMDFAAGINMDGLGFDHSLSHSTPSAPNTGDPTLHLPGLAVPKGNISPSTSCPQLSAVLADNPAGAPSSPSPVPGLNGGIRVFPPAPVFLKEESQSSIPSSFPPPVIAVPAAASPEDSYNEALRTLINGNQCLYICFSNIVVVR
jgi:hypothetical protein